MSRQGEWLALAVEEAWNLSLTARQQEQFERYGRQLLEWNEKMNLTAITAEEEVFVKHFFDSLTLISALPMDRVQSLVDVGTGAGFPGIPLKIVFPDIRLILLDSLRKRVQFLQEMAECLGLKAVEAVHGRAEEVARQRSYREQFDVATARAVAKLDVLAEYCMPFVRKGGWFVAMKGHDVENEIQGADHALRTLGGGENVSVLPFSLPKEAGKRHLIVVSKERTTPRAYPRKAGTPQRKPLGQ
ncbi:16S rRNA (guanine(527)-N(7))-methyltransferase RsmG [Desmospora profundinema]|uniref:Ribosomal RNA small subunit methyltransferase G n=1 Tax=Desmospora profundinema TaxID=1571184 RepID=A0ABU1IKQ9_9BACL|nr:16S rRNA (guanine(527)-N(7))-methyltransferase RsmG [Desmospora profundinema]MDR6225372.1 16S rRNA (guanine527-N7)-methyltransferase [Desmospora profundinema]